MGRNSRVAILFFVSLALLEFTSISNGKELFLGKFEIKNKKTKSPINVKTKKAFQVNYPPLHLHGIKNDRVKLINTGKAVEVIELNRSPQNESYAKEGVLLDDKYIFEIIRYLWSNQKNGTAASKINGKGFPLEAIGYFYNEKYKTFKESLNHRNGLVAIRFPVAICSTPSKTFPAFAKELKKILKAESSTITQLGITFEWYDQIPVNVTYYAYPGSYHDLENGKKYYCVTDIFPDYPGACITEEQYASTFGLMEKESGVQLISKEKTHPFRMPVVKAHGVTQTIVEA